MNKSVATHTAKPINSASIPITSIPKVRSMAEAPIAKSPIAPSPATKPRRRFRWAIYARKSTEKGLDSPFNSIDSQNYYCEKYIQDHQPEDEEWCIVGMYSDGGCSGYNTDRSDFQRLLADVKAGLFDGVAVYKSDRFARNLLDALQTIRTLREHNVDFVSVTQKFDTTTPHGRLSMNIMFSFDECYRDTSRDYTIAKIEISKKKGMWMGGHTPLGYDVVDKKLVVNEREVPTVRLIFAEFIKTKSVKRLVVWLREQGIKNKNAIVCTEYTPASIRTVLNNALYIGKVSHKGAMYDGQQQAIITDDVWQASRRVMQLAPKTRAGITKRRIPAVLAGLLKCGGCNSGMTPAYTKKKNGTVYRYYVADAHIKVKCVNCPIGHLSAPEIEGAVLQQLQQMVKTPELVVQAWQRVNANQRVNASQRVNQNVNASQRVNQAQSKLMPSTHQVRCPHLNEKTKCK